MTLGTLGVATGGLSFKNIGELRSCNDASDINLLLSRINTDLPGLDKVRSSMGDDASAARELMAYFKARQSVNHPIDRSQKKKSFGSIASENDIEAADNALKHVFVGQSAYPPHFVGEDIDWGFRPVPDNEWVWQLNRMNFWSSMGKTYWHTGKDKYAEGWAYQLEDWVRKNPNDEDHSYAWRSIEAGIRGKRWTDLFQYFIDSKFFTPTVLVTFLNSCYDHAEYLHRTYSKGSNWGLMEAEGMAYIAITFPEFKDAEDWSKEAFQRLNNEISIQVYPDGHQNELAMGYHLGSIAWFMRTYDLARMNGYQSFPHSYHTSIERMCEVPMKLCHPDGTNPQFGDAWAGSPGQHRSRLLNWAERFNRADFLYLATDGDEGEEPGSTAYALKDSGLYSMRSGWDKQAICLALKCGPDGGWHSQPDNGTFELSAGGRKLMPDSGCYIYSGDPENRAWFRQTKVHQTITLNGENSAYAPRLLLWQPADDIDKLVVENAGYPDMTHRRALFFVKKKYFVIVDEAYGEATGDVDLHFQLAPGDAVFNKDTFTARSNFKDGWNVSVKTLEQIGMKMLEEEGQVSFEYTKKEPRPAFCYRVSKDAGTSGIRYTTIVTPYSQDAPDLSAKIMDQPAMGGKGIDLEITENGSTKRIGYKLT